MSYVPPPASASVEICAISHKPIAIIRKKGKLVRTPCDHLFHRKHIELWLNTNPTCPTCRREIRAEQLRGDEGLLAAIGRIFMSILEFLWKGIVFCGEVMVTEESYYVQRDVYISRPPRPPSGYVPPSAPRSNLRMERDSLKQQQYSAYSTYSASGPRVQLGTHEDPELKRSPYSSSGPRVKLGNRA